MEEYLLPLGAALGGAIRSVYGYFTRKIDPKDPTTKFDLKKLWDSIIRGAIGGLIIGTAIPPGSSLIVAVGEGIVADVAIKEGTSPVKALWSMIMEKKGD